MEILNAKVETTYRHKETGELFKERKDFKGKLRVSSKKTWLRDVKVIMPALDLLSKTK
jgi:hypothetical protein